VTGGCGFIGSNFLYDFLKKHQDISIINLDKLTYAGNLDNLRDIMSHDNYQFVRGDIGDEQLVRQLIRDHHIDGILNFAAESHVDRSIADSQPFIDTNISGTANLLRLAVELKVGRYLQVSTDEVYGNLGDSGAFTEDTPLHPNSPYSASKAAADLFVQAFHHTYQLNTVITRSSNNYGPYQFPEKLIPLMYNNAQHNHYLPVYGDGMNVRDWLYVTDNCDGIWEVFLRGRPGEVYNIGGEQEKPNLEVVKTILNYLDKPDSLIQYVKDRPGHDRRYAIDIGKMRSTLGWKPIVDFGTGMQLTMDWYRTHPDWVAQVTSGHYQQYYREMYADRC
jgi:dTDP-glucose 4,6-dehydratase